MGSLSMPRTDRRPGSLSSLAFTGCAVRPKRLRERPIPQCTIMTTRTIPVELFDLAVFGATGDLSVRKLLPALFHRDLAGQIPEGARIIGISRRKLSDDEFRSFASKTIEEHTTEDERKPEVTARFLARLAYVALDASQDDGWDILGKAL